jgi:hypothetical protein
VKNFAALGPDPKPDPQHFFFFFFFLKPFIYIFIFFSLQNYIGRAYYEFSIQKELEAPVAAAPSPVLVVGVARHLATMSITTAIAS